MINKVILMGRLTADPELRKTQSDLSTCRFTVAVNRPFTNKQSGEREADFINVTCWRQTAEFVCRYFHKGSMIIVEGSLRNNNYTDQNNVKRYTLEVQADNVTFGESKSAQSGGQGVQGGQNYGQAPGYIQGGQGYNQGGYNQAPQNYGAQGGQGGYAQPAPMQQEPAASLGSLGDYSEILSDGEVPF